MDANTPAVSTLGRALLRLARSGATGTLRVTPRGQRQAQAKVHLRQGRVSGVVLADLNRLGRFLPPAAQEASAPSRAGEGPIGGRWLAEGRVSRPALSHALRQQMRRRVVTLLAWPRVSLRFDASAEPPDDDVEPWDTRDLVLAALREVVRPDRAAAALIRAGYWRLTKDAQGDLEGAALFPDEQAMLVVLREGAWGRDALAVAGNSPRAERALLGWRALGWLGPSRRGDYALLLRKQRELRQRVSHHRLLDLPPGASPAQARRALRRLVRSVHPDRFEPALQEPSTKVVRALVAAEASLRGR